MRCSWQDCARGTEAREILQVLQPTGHLAQENFFMIKTEIR